jgi:hypothetical protein
MQRRVMTAYPPISHDRLQRPCASSVTQSPIASFPRLGHAAAMVLRAVIGWQMRRLERRLAAFQPDDHVCCIGLRGF